MAGAQRRCASIGYGDSKAFDFEMVRGRAADEI
jgi:hypothetical protein